MELREYQTEFIDAVTHSFGEGHRRLMAVAATGAGKTILAAELMRREQGNCLFLAAARELINQNADKYTAHTGEKVGIEMGAQSARVGVDRVVVATTQSFHRRLDRYEPDHFNLIIVDECHSGTLGDAAQKIFNHFSYAKILGITATPFRSDRKELGNFYEKIAIDIGLDRLIREGYLSRIQIKSFPMSVDLREVKMSGGDYSTSDLGAVIEPILQEAANQLVTHAADRKKIVIFLPLVKTSIRMTRILNEMGIKAVHVSGEDNSQLREFTHGDARVICNAQLLTTGWDCPQVDCILVLRPTKSLPLYCLDEETEILTPEGFRGLDHFRDNPGSIAAVFDEKTGAIKWEESVGYIHRPMERDETWVSMDGPSTNIRVTNNHTMLSDNKRKTGWKRRTAESLAALKDTNYIPVSGRMEFAGVPLTDDELRFIGLVMTDGSINKANGAVYISQGEHQPWCEYIENTIIGCGFKFGKSIRNRVSQYKSNSKVVAWTISRGKARGRDKHLRGWGAIEPYLTKEIAATLESMNERQFDVMLEAIHVGDGSKQVNDKWTRRSYHISSGRIEFAERLQAMAVVRGWRSSISVGEWNENPIYIIHLKKQTFNRVGGTLPDRPSWVTSNPEPGDHCWCIETPTGTIVTRRRGKVAIMGNCQMIGRGTRIHPDKDKLLLLDPLFLTDDHRLITPARLVARDEEQAKAMMEKIAEDGGGDLLGVEVDIEEKRADALRARMEAKQKKKGRVVDAIEFAMACGDMETAEFQPEFGWEANPPSPKQMEALARAGFDTEEITTRGQASKVLDLLFLRRQKGLATPKQLKLMKQHGHPAPADATFDEASKWIDAKFASFGAGRGQAQPLPTSLLIRLRAAGLRAKDYTTKDSAEAALREIGAAA